MKIWTALLIPLLFAACAETEFLPYQGNAVRTGNGGAAKTVNGIEIWENGTPPRKYRIIGVIHDDRRENDMNHFEGRVAKTVQEHGGDGGIVESSQQRAVGAGDAIHFKRFTEVIVVKYL